jgi:hypothetical protein
MLNPRPPRQPLPAKQIEREGGTEDAKALNHPKEPQRRSPVYGTKAAATPLHPAQRETKSARDKDAQIAPQTHRQTTAGTHRSEPSLRRNAAHRDTQTTRDRTPSDRERTAEATRQKTPRQSTNEPPRPRAKPTDARRDTRQKEGTRHDRTKDARRQTHRLRDTNAQKTAADTAAGKLARHRNRPRDAHKKPRETAAHGHTGGGGKRSRRRQAQRTRKTPQQQKRLKNKVKTDGSWRQAIEGRKVASRDTTVGAPMNAHDVR